MDKLAVMNHKENQLKKMDNVYIDTLLPKKYNCTSTSRADYVDHRDTFVNNPQIRKLQTDPSLITGHYAHNLMVAGVQNKTKTWPQSMDWREDYAQFVKRNKWCNEEIYKLFFVCPPINYVLLKRYLSDLRKSVYMYDYSRDVYVSKRNQRLGTRNVSPYNPDVADYLTTYGCYYNRLHEMEPLRGACYPLPEFKEMTVDQFAANMRKLFTKYTTTTYVDEICGPALLKAKNGIMPSGHIDRYQFRKY